MNEPLDLGPHGRLIVITNSVTLADRTVRDMGLRLREYYMATQERHVMGLHDFPYFVVVNPNCGHLSSAYDRARDWGYLVSRPQIEDYVRRRDSAP